MINFFCLFLCTLTIAVEGATIERIIGGHDAPNHKYPYQVSFRERIGSNWEFHFCSGSIINGKWLVTAAHCLKDQNISKIVVAAGTNYLNERGESYEIEFYVIHEAYVHFTHNDICLVHVKGEIKFNNIVQPIRLPVDDLPSGYFGAVFSGWGNTDVDGIPPNNLQEIDLQIIPNGQCKLVWPIEKHVCTLNRTGQGTCYGDSGGPLVVNDFLVGIASYVNPCANGLPDVFTRVWSFIPWIRDTIIKHKISSKT